MSKPATLADLSDQMDRDMTWRRKELSDMKAAIKRADSIARPVLLRALVALLYAHWEGHVRLCATKYFQYIALRKLTYTQLEDQIYLNSFLARLDVLFRSKGNVEEKCNFIQEVLNSKNKRFSQFKSELINTKSNLNTDVLRDLCRICGIPFSDFESMRTFIDVMLLKRRNEIAHGQEVYPNEDDVDGLVDQTINAMRLFRTLLENKLYTQSYLAKPCKV